MTLTFSPRRCMVMTMCFMHAKINLIGQLVPDRVATDGRTDRTDRITFPVRKVRTRSVKILLTVRDVDIHCTDRVTYRTGECSQ